MQVSAIGRAALASREGDKLVAYKDSVGVWTISVGVTTASGLINVTPGLRITQAQSDDLFARAVEQYAEPVRKALKRSVTQEQFDALVSLCYNIGPGAFAGSTVVRRINAGDIAGAAEAILMWKKPAVIITRRQGEYDQFRTPYSVSLPRARRDDAKPVSVPAASVPAPAPAPAAPKPAPSFPATPAPSADPTPAVTSLWEWLKSLAFKNA